MITKDQLRDKYMKDIPKMITDKNQVSYADWLEQYVIDSINIDFDILRKEYFKEHVSHKTTDGIPVVCTHPHNLFEWFRKMLSKE